MKRIFILLTVLLLGVFSAQASEEAPILRLINQIRVERPHTYKNLTIFPLTLTKFSDERDYLTLDEAVKESYLRISELSSAEVNEVLVENRSKYFVFLLASELLAGCKQDRMVANDCLLPPQSGKIHLKVYCTEHGRWQATSESFKSLGAAPHLSMRQLAKETKSQERVWNEVESKQAELGVTSAPTGAFKSVLDDKEVQQRCQPYFDEFSGIPRLNYGGQTRLSRNVCGVVVAVGNEILCADIFTNPSLFRKLWFKLLKSYVLDVLNRPIRNCDLSRRDIERFVEIVLEADFRAGETDGVGRAVEIYSSRLSGSALIYQDCVIHCDLFPKTMIPREDDENTPKLQYRREKVRE
ncbi:MAG: DUF6569 family protein [Candidatus Edwardsbacteria bacterium]